MESQDTISNRLLGVMVLLTIATAALLYFIEKSYRSSTAESLEAVAIEKRETLSRAMRQLSRSMESFANQAKQIPDTTTHIESWASGAENNLGPAARTAEIDAALYLDLEGKPIAGINLTNQDSKALASFLTAKKNLPSDKDQAAMYFLVDNGLPLQIAFSPVTTATEPDRILGYIIVARYWDREFIRTLGQFVGGQLTITPVTELEAIPSGFLPDHVAYRVSEMGLGVSGSPVFGLSALFPLDRFQVENDKAAQRRNQMRMAILALLLLMFAVIWKWLAYPIQLVSDALEKDDPTLLRPILNEDYDWARIARRLTEASEERLMLNREVREQREQMRIQEETAKVRSAMARDLHDGVIQSVYAVALQLDRVRRKLPEGSEAATELVKLCQDDLSVVNADLRAYIRGLGPESVQQNGLAEALQNLVNNVQRTTSTPISAHIDPQAQAPLNTMQALHLYQIARELLSNAVRHAEASTISLSLLVKSRNIELIAKDNGKGIDKLHITEGSYGLKNIHDRATQIGADITFASSAPSGSEIRITLTPPQKPNE
ncbi:MAG: ATP-binding protein [Puniceicoccales bacterium]